MASIMFLYLMTTNSINKYLSCIYFVADPAFNAETEPWGFGSGFGSVLGIYSEVYSTEKLKEIHLGSFELRAVLN